MRWHIASSFIAGAVLFLNVGYYIGLSQRPVIEHAPEVPTPTPGIETITQVRWTLEVSHEPAVPAVPKPTRSVDPPTAHTQGEANEMDDGVHVRDAEATINETVNSASNASQGLEGRWRIRLVPELPWKESREQDDGEFNTSATSSVERGRDLPAASEAREFLSIEQRGVSRCADCGTATDNAPDGAGEVFCSWCRAKHLDEGRRLQAEMDAGTATTCHFCGGYAPSGKAMCPSCIEEYSNTLLNLR